MCRELLDMRVRVLNKKYPGHQGIIKATWWQKHIDKKKNNIFHLLWGYQVCSSRQCLYLFWIRKVSITCIWGAFSEKANFGFFERVLWKGKFWPKFSQNLPLQPKFAFSQNHWNMPKNWNLCPFLHSINLLDESHCKGTEELIQKNNWSHKKFSYFITERVKDSSF